MKSSTYVSVTEVTEIPENPSFNKRFESIVRNMTRKEVINILGFPDAIYNKTTTKYVYLGNNHFLIA
jgi:hypothetical protein